MRRGLAVGTRVSRRRLVRVRRKGVIAMGFDPAKKGQNVELGTLADVRPDGKALAPSAKAKIDAAVSRVEPGRKKK